MIDVHRNAEKDLTQRDSEHMPHLDIKYKEALISGDQLFEITDSLKTTIGSHFKISPDYVSVEIRPQSKWTSNRKGVDVELNCDPDESGLRKKVIKELSEALEKQLTSFLEELNIQCDLSVWARIYDSGHYHLKF